MLSCNSPCAPNCKYGGYQEVDKSKALKPDPICTSPTQNIEAQGSSKAASPIPALDSLRPVPKGDPPCYLPQIEDMPGRQVSTGEPPSMGPIGPWATGRVDWGPLAGLTGTRPVVSKYSVTRYSEGEWRQRNADTLNENYMQQHRANLVSHTSHQCMAKSTSDTDKDQEDSTKRLERRANEIHRWKCELERAIEATTEELNILMEQHTRLKNAMAILTIPESIAAECIDIRSSRLEPDLVRDEVEEELIKELALTAEIRDIFNRTLTDIVKKITEERAAKQRLEFDWSDKKVGHEVERLNCSLNSRSTILMFKPGGVRMPEEQSSNEYWEHFTRESLYQGEMTRQSAVAFRGTLDAILMNASRDLRSQADKVDGALARRIACTEELRSRMEAELKKVLDQIVNMEKSIEALQLTIRNLDFPMKEAQTRLDNKLSLPRVENCRDKSTFGLIEEVKSISTRVAALNAELKQAEDCKAALIIARGTLEREIMIKLKNLWIDKERIQFLRSHYPSATALSGH